MGAEVFAISVDAHFSAGAWAAERGFTFPMLGDLDRKAITSYGVALATSAGYHNVADRAMFVIDRSGTVVYAERVPTPGDQPDPDAALEAVRRLAER